MNGRSFFVALIIVLISYFFLRFFGFKNYSLAHYLFAAFIMGSLVMAFLTKKKDITLGILYGLIALLTFLLSMFIIYSKGTA